MSDNQVVETVKELKKYIEESTCKEKCDWQKIVDCKKRLDAINFEGLYSRTYFDNDLGIFLPNVRGRNCARLVPLDGNQISSNNPVAKAFSGATECLQQSKDPELRLGTVSNGVHATELIGWFFTPEMLQEIHWNTKRVMVVFEAPSKNLDCSHGLSPIHECTNKEYKDTCIRNYVKENKERHFSLEENLTEYWWRLDSKRLRNAVDAVDKKEVKCNKQEGCRNCFDCFRKQSYTGFLLALIAHFGLANLYTTNYCRFELFEAGEMSGDREKFLGWKKTVDAVNGKLFAIEEQLFKREYKDFQPEIILATANPYYRLTGENSPIKEKDRVIKIIHPASRYPGNFRLCYNMCALTKELQQKNIIDGDCADTMFKAYRDMKTEVDTEDQNSNS